MSDETMCCAYCGAVHPWTREHFPVRIAATCRACLEEMNRPWWRKLLAWLRGAA